MRVIKITGYIEIDDVEAEHLDLEHETGFSASGYDYYLGPESNIKLADLFDLDSEVIHQ